MLLKKGFLIGFIITTILSSGCSSNGKVESKKVEIPKEQSVEIEATEKHLERIETPQEILEEFEIMDTSELKVVATGIEQVDTEVVVRVNITNKTKEPLILLSNYCSINNTMANGFIYTEIAAASSIESSIRYLDTNISDFTNIKGYLFINDVNLNELYSKEYSFLPSKYEQKTHDYTKIHEDDFIKLFLVNKEITDDGYIVINLFCENKSTENIFICSDGITVDEVIDEYAFFYRGIYSGCTSEIKIYFPKEKDIFSKLTKIKYQILQMDHESNIIYQGELNID